MQHRVPQRERPGVRERREQRDQSASGEMKHDGETAEAGADDDANPQRRRLPGGDRHQRRGHDDNGRDAQPVASPAPPLVAQQQRRLDETDLQQRHDRKQHRYQHADGDALRRRAPGDAVARLGQQRRRRRPERQRDRRDGGARNGDAEEAAGQPEPHHLQHVDGDDLRVARADALEHRDAANFLQDEHPRDARHRDAAENHDDQADQAEIVLRPIEVPADLIFSRAVRSRGDEFVAQFAAQRRDQRIHVLVGHLHVQAAIGAAAKAEQPR